MTDPSTPKKLRELADDPECGESGLLMAASVVAETQDHLRAAADEIERLNADLDDAAYSAKEDRE